MNPLFNALNGSTPSTPVNAQNGPSQPQIIGPANSFPINNLQAAIERAKQIMQSTQNPQQFVSQYLPGVPANIANDPNQIMNWLQQTGRVNPQMVQMANQLAGMMRH